MNCHSQPITSVIPEPFYKPVNYPDTPIGRVQRLRDYVCRRSYLTVDQLLVKSKRWDIVLPKQIICYLAVNWKIASRFITGKQLGYVDHTMAFHGHQTIADLISTGQLPEAFKWVQELEAAGFESIVNSKTKQHAD